MGVFGKWPDDIVVYGKINRFGKYCLEKNLERNLTRTSRGRHGGRRNRSNWTRNLFILVPRWSWHSLWAVDPPKSNEFGEFDGLSWFWTPHWPQVTEGVSGWWPSFFLVPLDHMNSFECDYHVPNLPNHALKLWEKLYMNLKLSQNRKLVPVFDRENGTSGRWPSLFWVPLG